MITVAAVTPLLGALAIAAPQIEHIEHERSIFDDGPVCNAIKAAISPASDYHTYLSPGYLTDISHWATSSTIWSDCSVEPGTPEDIATILRIVAQNKYPFGVKGGGHTTNPGFSASSGVQIAMYKFGEVVYHPDTQTVDIGAGLVWDDVYAALEPYGVNVVGGRVTGVGVAGFSLGGGYSWLSNQHGFTVDNIVSYDIVLPTGDIKHVDASTPDLFFALKGGYNNFGIVYRFTMKAYKQGQVWGGLLNVLPGSMDALVAATAKFSETVADPQAGIITTFNHLLGQTGASQLLFYDGPNPPKGMFDDFLALSCITKDVSTRSFLSLVLSSPANLTSTLNNRGVFHTVSLEKYSPTILKAILNETTFWGSELTGFSDSGLFASYDVEPFMAAAMMSKAPEGSSAYPPTRSRPLVPLNIYLAWEFSSGDDANRLAAVQSAEQITRVAASEGQFIGDAPLYGNYAIAETPLERIYGAQLPRMRQIKTKYDPYNVMGLAGGWKL